MGQQVCQPGRGVSPGSAIRPNPRPVHKTLIQVAWPPRIRVREFVHLFPLPDACAILVMEGL